MPSQSCPNCQRTHDVGIYVTGQRVLCACGIKFEVRRQDVSVVGGRSVGSRVATTPARKNAPSPVPEAVLAAAGKGESAVATGAQLPEGLEQTVVRPESRNEVVVSVTTGDTQLGNQLKPELPGYELVEILGRGGMGEVWRATQKSLGRTVAVKVLPSKLAKDQEFVARFDKEATALAALSHPNIIQIIDRGFSGEHYYFVMEFVAGKSLRELVSPQLPPQEALKVCAQISRAIDYAHEKNIIHRDLKPENILVDDRGHVKVADFGLAGIRGPEAPNHLTATSVAMGTVNYMAPEQRRDARNVDGRADLYSLGVMLYELLTGELPIGRFRLPSEKIAAVDPRVDEVVAKMLETDPSHRYQSAREVTEALETIVGSVASAAPVSSPRLSNPALPAAGSSSNKNPSVIHHGFRGVKLFLMVVGGLGVLGFITNALFGNKELFSLQTQSGSKVTVATSGIKLDPKHAPDHVLLPGNTYGDLFAVAQETEDGAQSRLELTFTPGDEKLNAHSGEWEMKDGALHALQAGNETNGNKLIPRAYVAHHYFSADDFTAEVDVKVKGVDEEYKVDPEAQRFAELAFRIKDLQVSIFVIRGVGLRLLWRYYTPDGVEVTGNSAKDLELMVEDEMPAPPDGSVVHLKLQLKRGKKGVEVEAFANKQRFARKVLPGLEGQIGKIAVGCRNLDCTFNKLVAYGKTAERPSLREQK